MKHAIEIHYWPQCRWLLRASWMAQELLSTFDGDIERLTLRPEIFELKQRLRDRIDRRHP